MQWYFPCYYNVLPVVTSFKISFWGYRSAPFTPKKSAQSFPVTQKMGDWSALVTLVLGDQSAPNTQITDVQSVPVIHKNNFGWPECSGHPKAGVLSAPVTQKRVSWAFQSPKVKVTGALRSPPKSDRERDIPMTVVVIKTWLNQDRQPSWWSICPKYVILPKIDEIQPTILLLQAVACIRQSWNS